MEMSANRLKWPFCGNMMQELERGDECDSYKLSDSLVCMTKAFHYQNLSYMADINVTMTAACSGKRSGGCHWISDQEMVRIAG